MPLAPPAACPHRDPRHGWSQVPAGRPPARVSRGDDRAVHCLLHGGPRLHRHWHVPARNAWSRTPGRASLAGRRPGRGAKLRAVGQGRQPARPATGAPGGVRGAGGGNRPARDGGVAGRGPAVGDHVRRHVRGHRRDGVRLGRHATRRPVATLRRDNGLLLRRRPGARAAAGAQRRSCRAAAGRCRRRLRRRAPVVPGLVHHEDGRDTSRAGSHAPPPCRARFPCRRRAP